ncbi:hypothetical protein [Oryzobacter telluris]|uniref:hypothetical protein n=1 Tax=Oryzobacter telluris TaxID=3149179 RepID=UPI00370D1A61
MAEVVGELPRETSSRPECWCCGSTVEESALTRLGNHPEVGLCAGCAQWVHRRSRARAESGLRTPAVTARRSVAGVRDWVIANGAHGWPVLGPVLRRLDRLLP